MKKTSVIKRTMNAEQAVEQFLNDLNRTVKTAIDSDVPLENIILALDLKHLDVSLMRQAITAQHQAQQTTNGIVAASRMPKNLTNE